MPFLVAGEETIEKVWLRLCGLQSFENYFPNIPILTVIGIILFSGYLPKSKYSAGLKFTGFGFVLRKWVMKKWVFRLQNPPHSMAQPQVGNIPQGGGLPAYEKGIKKIPGRTLTAGGMEAREKLTFSSLLGLNLEDPNEDGKRNVEKVICFPSSF